MSTTPRPPPRTFISPEDRKALFRRYGRRQDPDSPQTPVSISSNHSSPLEPGISGRRLFHDESPTIQRSGSKPTSNATLIAPHLKSPRATPRLNSLLSGNADSGGFSSSRTMTPPPAYNQHSRTTSLLAHSSDLFDPSSTQWSAAVSSPSTTKLAENMQQEQLECEAIAGFTGRLLEHQKYARTWMADCEAGPQRGGLLNDEMGLGKTIEVIVRMNDCNILQKEKGPTLIVCPLALMPQWAKEIQRFTPKMTVYTHHESRRARDASVLLSYDVVLTTYGILTSERKNYLEYLKQCEMNTGHVGSSRRQAKPFMAIFQTDFLRVVLDECHEIRNTPAQKTQACWLLRAKYRWGLTGTLIHNKADDLYSYFKFLRIPPYNDEARFQMAVKGGFMSDIVNYMSRFHLRRTKAEEIDGQPIVELPKKELKILPMQLGEHEREFYEALKKVLMPQIDAFALPRKNKYTDAGSRLKDTANGLTLILRLRQACCHPHLCLMPAGSDDLKEGQLASVDSDLCFLCLRQKPSKQLESNFCSDCLHQVVRRANVGSSDMLYSRDSEKTLSSKMNFMWDLIRKIQKDSRGKDKIVIFSQWTSYLDIILNFLLRKTTTTIIRYDGRMNAAQRTAVLESFNDDPSVTIGLFSIKAGGVGLNLTAANHVILMDLQYNPAVEDQAFDRVHRIGQTKPVTIYKLLVPETIEVGIQQIQTRKRRMAEDILAGVRTAAKHTGIMKDLARAARFNRVD